MADSKVLQPVGYRVLIKPLEEELQTAGGLIVPPSTKEDSKPSFGEIIALGNSEDDFPIKVGDKVFFKKFSPEEITHNNETYLIVEVDDIIAIVK